MSSTTLPRQANAKLLVKKNESKKNQEKKQLDVKKQEKRKKLETKKQNDVDFVIFCDENDELSVKAVEKENLQQNKKLKSTSEIVNEEKKKKGLSDRNAANLIKQQQKKLSNQVCRKENVQQKDKLQTNQQNKATEQKKKKGLCNRNATKTNLVANKKNEENKSNVLKKIDEKLNEKSNEKNLIKEITKENIQQKEKRQPLTDIKKGEKLNDQLKEIKLEEKKCQPTIQKNDLKEEIVDSQLINQYESVDLGQENIISIHNLKLDESTLSEENNLIDESLFSENKENDPTLMSIELSKDEPEEKIVKYNDTCGDMKCSEFSNEIYCYMLEREKKFVIDSDYMSKQPEITSKMRAMLIDWLIDVGVEYELENETVFLAVNYIDRFLSILTISLQNFQLLGTAALFIASKYEEIYPPEVKEFIFVTDDAYTKGQMFSMEKLILKSLQFNISPPTPFYFLKYFLTKLTLPNYVEFFAEYICFLSSLEVHPFLQYSPSDIAISSIIMALHTYSLQDIVNLDEFKQLAQIHSHIDEEGNLSDEKAILVRQNCVNAMYEMQKNAPFNPQKAVYEKYSSEKYLSVANVEMADEVPLVIFYLL